MFSIKQNNLKQITQITAINNREITLINKKIKNIMKILSKKYVIIVTLNQRV